MFLRHPGAKKKLCSDTRKHEQPDTLTLMRFKKILKSIYHWLKNV